MQKLKLQSVHAIMAYKGITGIAPLILNFRARWGELSTSRSGRCTPGKEPRYPLNRRVGGPQSRSGRLGEERLACAEARTPNRPACSQINAQRNDKYRSWLACTLNF